MTPLEADEEQKFVDGCAQLGLLTIKFTPKGDVGWPDRIVLTPVKPLWIELKRRGEKPRKLQKHKLKVLRKLGYDAQWFDSAAAAIRYVARRLAATQVPG